MFCVIVCHTCIHGEEEVHNLARLVLLLNSFIYYKGKERWSLGIGRSLSILAVFPLSSPSAHSEMCCPSFFSFSFFGGMGRGFNRNRTSLSEPKANSEER